MSAGHSGQVSPTAAPYWTTQQSQELPLPGWGFTFTSIPTDVCATGYPDNKCFGVECRYPGPHMAEIFPKSSPLKTSRKRIIYPGHSNIRIQHCMTVMVRP